MMTKTQFWLVLLSLPVLSQAITTVICESEKNILNCENGRIHIQNAMYGRMSADVCTKFNNIEIVDCAADGVLAIVIAECEGDKLCSLEASNGWFGDPCVGYYKYLLVDYECK